MSTRALGQDERERIAEDIRAGLARNEIARKHKRAAGTVTAIANDYGLTFDRSATKDATEAAKADVDARMTQLACDLLSDAERMRKQLWEPCTIHSFGGRDNTHASWDLDEPVFADKRHIVGSVRMLATTVHDIRSRNAGDGGKSMIERLFESLTEAAA